MDLTVLFRRMHHRWLDSFQIQPDGGCPGCIEAGCDVLLFNKDVDEDIMFMVEGIKNGLLSRERLEDAVTRVLATKAALNLHKKKEDGSIYNKAEALATVGCDEHRQWAEEVADEGITLVKNLEGTLPISPEKTKRVFLEILGEGDNDAVRTQVVGRLEKEGLR